MDVQSILSSLQNCACGRAHGCELRAVECESGLVRRAGALLRGHGFPRDVLLVGDENTFAAAEGLEKSLADAGFRLRRREYGNLRTADMEEVRALMPLVHEAEGVIAVGTGSIGDICRLASFREGRDFAIFATAPSMDGFASGSAPITENSFKTTVPARQPSVVLADTAILSKAPAELKSAGFGDMLAKYVGLVDWQVAHLVVGEYLCKALFDLTREALMRSVALVDKVTAEDETAAAAVFEALCFTGIAMRAANCTRPGSGTEHILSHFWECKKLEKGELSDFHGKKCAVATRLVSRVYHDMAAHESIEPRPEKIDWEAVREAYGPHLYKEVEKLNFPDNIIDEVQPETLRAAWPEIRRIVREELPDEEALLGLMRRAGCATEPAGIGVSDALAAQGLRYHTFMRRRMSLMRLRPMLGMW